LNPLSFFGLGASDFQKEVECNLCSVGWHEANYQAARRDQS